MPFERPPRRSPAKEVGATDDRRALTWAGCAFDRPDGVFVACCDRPMSRRFRVVITPVPADIPTPPELSAVTTFPGHAWASEIEVDTQQSISPIDLWIDIRCDLDPAGSGGAVKWFATLTVCCAGSGSGTGPAIDPDEDGRTGRTGIGPTPYCDTFTEEHPAFYGVDCDFPATFGWTGITPLCYGHALNVDIVEEDLESTHGSGTIRTMAKRVDPLEFAAGTWSGSGDAPADLVRPVYVRAECFDFAIDPGSGAGPSGVSGAYPVYGSGDPPEVLFYDWATVGRALAKRVRPVEFATGTWSGSGDAPAALRREAWVRTCCTAFDLFSSGPSGGTATGTGSSPPPPETAVGCCPEDFLFPGRLYLTFIRDPASVFNVGCDWFGDSFTVAVDYRGVGGLGGPAGIGGCPPYWTGQVTSAPVFAGDTSGQRCTVVLSICTGTCNSDPDSFRGWWVIYMACTDSTGRFQSCGMTASGTSIHGTAQTVNDCRYRKFLCRRPVYETIGVCSNGNYVWNVCGLLAPASPNPLVCPPYAPHPTLGCLDCDGLVPGDDEWPGYALQEHGANNTIYPCCSPYNTSYAGPRWAVIVQE